MKEMRIVEAGELGCGEPEESKRRKIWKKTGLAKLEDVANQTCCKSDMLQIRHAANRTKKIPDKIINREGNFVTQEFIKYAKPLIGGPLPGYVRLEGISVKSNF